MVVCICNAIRETEIRAAARSGCHTPCRAYASLGRQARCGQCGPYARQIIDAERAVA